MEEKTAHIKKESPVFSWEPFDSYSTKKSNDWYFILWVIAITGTVISIIVKNILFAIFIIIAAFTVTIYASRKPKRIQVSISKKEVSIDSMRYPLSSFSHFSIAEQEIYPYLILKSKKPLEPLLTIPLTDEVDFEDLSNFLLTSLEEEALDLPTYQRILDRFGF